MNRLQKIGRCGSEMWQFVRENRLWWLSPVLVLLLVAGSLQVVVTDAPLHVLIFAMF